MQTLARSRLSFPVLAVCSGGQLRNKSPPGRGRTAKTCCRLSELNRHDIQCKAELWFRELLATSQQCSEECPRLSTTYSHQSAAAPFVCPSTLRICDIKLTAAAAPPSFSLNTQRSASERVSECMHVCFIAPSAEKRFAKSETTTTTTSTAAAMTRAVALFVRGGGGRGGEFTTTPRITERNRVG